MAGWQLLLDVRIGQRLPRRTFGPTNGAYGAEIGATYQ